MSSRDQVIAQFYIVEDFAVERNDNRSVLVCHGLLAGSQVNDAQPHVPQANIFAEINAVTVGATMRNRTQHSFQQQGLLVGLCYRTPVKSYNAAHRSLEPY